MYPEDNTPQQSALPPTPRRSPGKVDPAPVEADPFDYYLEHGLDTFPALVRAYADLQWRLWGTGVASPTARSFRALLDGATLALWRKHPEKRPRAGEVALAICPANPQTWDADKERQQESSRQQLTRKLRDLLGMTWREYIATVRSP
jgi:hypothetical protein